MNSSSKGYHETLTIFWCKIIQTYISLNNEKPIEDLISDFLKSNLASKKIVIRFYDEEKLMSQEYRTIYFSESKLKIDSFTIEIMDTIENI